MKPSLILATISLLAACGSSDGIAPPDIDPLAGQYVLQSVGGKALPAVIWRAGTTTDAVVSGTLSLGSEGMFGLTFAFKEMDNDVQFGTGKRDFLGTWARNGSATVTLQVLHDLTGERLVGIQSNTGITVTGIGGTDVGTVPESDFFFSRSK